MRQHFTDCKYSVVFSDYAEKNYTKDFEKKYKKHWDVTRESIITTLERISNLSGTKLIDFICISNKDTCLVKFDFKVAKTNKSAKTSGNRCILEVCNRTFSVRVLLIYSKEHISRDGKETLWWKEHISTSCNLCCV